MPVIPTPIFTQTPKHVAVAVSVANTNEDGSTGTYATIVTAGALGSKVERIVVRQQGTCTAEKVRLFIGGKIFWSETFDANTPSNTSNGQQADLDCSLPGTAIILTAGETITANVNTGAGNIFIVHVFYGDY